MLYRLKVYIGVPSIECLETLGLMLFHLFMS